MILDPEMRLLLKQLADNTGRLARAMEAVLDASEEEVPSEPSPTIVGKINRQPLAWEGSGGRISLHDVYCDCSECEEWRRANR